MAKNSQFRNRLPVFIRDDWRCQFCGKDLLADEQSLRQATVDHFIPTKLGGNGNNKNLVACCFLCNQAKGSFPVADIADAQRVVWQRRQTILANLVEELHRIGQSFPRHQQSHILQATVITVAAATPSPSVPETFEKLPDEPADMFVDDVVNSTTQREVYA